MDRNPPRLRVLHVIPSVSPAHGGPSKAIATIEAALAAADVGVTTATTDDDGPGRRYATAARPAAPDGIERIYGAKWSEFYKIAPGLAAWLWRNVRSYDVVHIHALFSFTSIAAALISRSRGVAYIVRPLGTLTAYGVTQRRPGLKRLSLWLFEAPILRHAAAVHFTSQAEWDEARSLGVPFRGVVVPLGVDQPRQVDPQVLMREHPRLKGRRIVLFLSRLDPKKNPEGLLRAFAGLDRQRLRATLVVAGDGTLDYVMSLKALARSLQIEDDVVWLGHVSQDRKSAAFAAADVFVLPSFSENFGIAAVEALLAGLPCVLGRGVAIAGDVEQTGAGMAVPPDASAIARAIEHCLANEASRCEMGQRGRALAEREYSTRTMAERLIKLYEEVHLARGGTRA